MHQAVGADELCIDHIGALFLAEFTEGWVAYVFHWRQQKRKFSEIYIANSDVTFVFVVYFRH